MERRQELDIALQAVDRIIQMSRIAILNAQSEAEAADHQSWIDEWEYRRKCYLRDFYGTPD